MAKPLYKRRLEVNVEFLVVSKTKLKAILDKEDMIKYKLDGAESGADSITSRRAFREILAVATEEVGFDTEKDKVLIQLYPSRDGGGELFVTKLGSISKTDMRAIAGSESVTMLTNISRLFRFDDLEGLIFCAKSIGGSDIPSTAYYIDGAYFLHAQEKCTAGGISELSRISEFAERLPEKLVPYVKEQGRAIFTESAIEKLAALGGKRNIEKKGAMESGEF